MSINIAKEKNQTSQERLLNLAESYFIEEVAPIAADLDRDSKTLLKSLKEMGGRSMLALMVPRSWRGGGLSEVNFRRFQFIISQYSGALAFLQTQHQSAGLMLAKSDNQTLKQRYLPLMGNGASLMGVGFSHLRRRHEVMVKAIPVEGGYYLEGSVPWITGFDLFENFIIGAKSVDGCEVYGVLPFTEKPNLHFSKPMDLISMTSSNTVSATVEGYFLKQDDVIAVKDAQDLINSDYKTVLKQSFFSLGCASAANKILENIYYKKKLNCIKETWESLNQELIATTEKIFTCLTTNESYEVKLALRVEAINLATRCASAAAIASSGAANELSNPAGRVYREALQFSVLGQTPEVMEGSLKLLRS